MLTTRAAASFPLGWLLVVRLGTERVVGQRVG